MRVRSGSSSSVHSTGSADETSSTDGGIEGLKKEFISHLKGVFSHLLGMGKCLVKGIVQTCIYMVAACVSEYETTQQSSNGPRVHKHNSTTTHTETGKN